MEKGRKDFPIKPRLTLNASLRIPLRPSLLLLMSMNVRVAGNSGSCLILLSRSTSSSSWGSLRKASSWISDIKFAVKSILFKLSGRERRWNNNFKMYFLKVLKNKRQTGYLNYRWRVLNQTNSWLTVITFSLYILQWYTFKWFSEGRGSTSPSSCLKLSVSLYTVSFSEGFWNQ